MGTARPYFFRYEANGVSQNELAEMTVKDAPTVTRIIDLLVKKGLAERTMAENDRLRSSTLRSRTLAGKSSMKPILWWRIFVKRAGAK
ncbi:MAG: MarR family transcriptional regulator [Arcicella sp.]|nr:MarR family transcriptional regulator [Arcicella sp.]